ncbi:hypothetical protein BCR39DRAFT_323623 [Naematelia encephala]|uniref:M-phase inducer phosphatase n=1 Tax=Naematelia encephala TaxID=71784 RepID=A0A1Y2APB2_9TREE|nr:hypothetical protein BCR39DRAFT_323623 [Naematelia encephala]
MDCFSSSPLVESFPTSRFLSPTPSPTRTEVDLPIEVDQSFNSSMSLGGHDSPSALSPSPSTGTGFLISPSPSLTGDFLSPTPAFAYKPRRPDPVPIQSRSPLSFKTAARDASTTLGSKRTFGRELSNNAMQRLPGPITTKAAKGMMLPPAVPDVKSTKPKLGVSMQWSSSNEDIAPPRLCFQPAFTRRETEPILISPRPSKAESDDLSMDVDSPQMPFPGPSPIQRSPAFAGSSSYSGSPGLGSYFCNSPAAPPAVLPSKRRSLISGSPGSPGSSPSAKRTSLGLGRNVEKTASSSAMLFGGGRPNAVGSRRPQPYKRPPLMAAPGLENTSGRSTSAISAYPILYGAPKQTLGQAGTFPRAATAPMRRAFSVCDQGSMPPPEMEEDESEFEASPSVGGPHAEYARRHGKQFVPRVDGSPGFKAARSSIAVTGQGAASPTGKGKKPSPYGPGGLPGFGDNEMDGKILPCHKVKEDGLVRITVDTLDNLISGKYDDKVRRYHILDCRFDYEYTGGHVDGAINVRSMESLDELLLSEKMGVHANGNPLPTPSRSGELEDGEQVVLVFHCEFSAKRAPTFAKHLRSRDRSLNGHLYPKIYYPEVYILEGGYSGFYSARPHRCDPQGYTPMDDPRHFDRRDSDLHDFRKFSRTRSFTYGETQPPPPRAALPCPPLAFAAASAAVGRRHGPTIAEEDHEHDSSSPSHGADTSAEMDASPCARVVSTGGMLAAMNAGGGLQPPIFGSAKTRQFGRMGMTRVQSYAGTTIR